MSDQKQSQFIEVNELIDSDYVPVFGRGTNRKISKANLFAQINDEDKTFVYETINQVEQTNLSIGSYLRVEETGYKLYKVTSIAASANDIALDNGQTATLQYEYAFDSNIASIEDYGAVDGAPDSTDAIRACKLVETIFKIPKGQWNISGDLQLYTNQYVVIEAGAQIKQLTDDTRIFFAVGADNVWIDFRGGELYGKGTDWVNSGGNQGRFAKGIEFLGCTNSGAKFPVCKNFGSAGISIIGGEANIIHPIIEGTNLHGTPIILGDNFQQGIYVANDATYGALKVTVTNPDISGTAQGILREGITSNPGDFLKIVSPTIHDITGQHAMYIQAGSTVVTNPVVQNIALAGFKVQLFDANINDGEFVCTGMSARNLGSQMFEISALGTGVLRNVRCDGVGKNVGRMVSINGGTAGAHNITVQGSAETVLDEGVYIFGDKLKDIDVTPTIIDSGLDGVFITATNSQNIRLHNPTIRNANTTNTPTGGISGIRIESNSATVHIYHPDIEDVTGGFMKYGIYHSIVGGIVYIYNKIRVYQAKDYAIRAVGSILSFPTDAEQLTATNGSFLGLQNIKSPHAMVLTTNSSSASDIILWQYEMLDETSIMVTVDLVGKWADGSKRRAVKATALFYRDGGGICTLEGAVDVDADIATAAFAGVYAIQSSGANTATLVVNSGGVTDINWKARVTVSQL